MHLDDELHYESVIVLQSSPLQTRRMRVQYWIRHSWFQGSNLSSHSHLAQFKCANVGHRSGSRSRTVRCQPTLLENMNSSIEMIKSFQTHINNQCSDKGRYKKSKRRWEQVRALTILDFLTRTNITLFDFLTLNLNIYGAYISEYRL